MQAMMSAHRKRTALGWNALICLARCIFPSHGLRDRDPTSLNERQLQDMGIRTRNIAAMVDRDMSELLCRDLWRRGPKARS